MKTMEDAQKLAHLMVEIGRYFKKIPELRSQLWVNL